MYKKCFKFNLNNMKILIITKILIIITNKTKNTSTIQLINNTIMKNHYKIHKTSSLNIRKIKKNYSINNNNKILIR